MIDPVLELVVDLDSDEMDPEVDVDDRDEVRVTSEETEEVVDGIGGG